ncbi:MAG: hypothetical protein IJY22_05515 [Clostridia bacterium]|nr:hypothetical protein [Clostridia bacterium]
MGRWMAVIVIFCVWGVLMGCVGCVPMNAEPLACLQKAFVAEVEGSLHGQAFTAVIEAEKTPESGTRVFTVTFYAPVGLAGTVLRRGADGAVTVSSGDVTVPLGADSGFCALFALFPTSAQVTGATLDQNRRTQVDFVGGSITLLSDGTPFFITTPAATVRVVSFAAI